MTGGAPFDDPKRHPIVRWAADGVKFSLSTDDTTLLDNSMLSELQFVREKIGFTLEQIWQCVSWPMRAFFF